MYHFNIINSRLGFEISNTNRCLSRKEYARNKEGRATLPCMYTHYSNYDAVY